LTQIKPAACAAARPGRARPVGGRRAGDPFGPVSRRDVRAGLRSAEKFPPAPLNGGPRPL